MNTDDALEVAKLAAAVGGQLKTIDQFTSERSSNPANKINIQNFINKVKNPRASIPPADYLTKPPPGFAPPPSEDYIQMVEPDMTIGSKPSNPQPIAPIQPVQSIPNPPVQELQTLIPNSALTTETPMPVVSPNIEKQSVNKFNFNENLSISKSDVDSIKKSLNGIDKSLQKIVILFDKNK
jgi:hypothetical protein